MIFGTLNPEKIWHERLTHLSTSPVRCSHFTLGNPKKSFFNIIIHILQIIYITSEAKPIATVVVQFQLFTYCCLVLPVICIALVLHLGHATGGARVLIRTCWSLRQRLVATWAEFQHSVVYYATDHVKKRLEACINAEGGHSEHFLWHCLPDNRYFSEPPMTAHNWLSSEPPTFERTQQTFSQIKKFCSSQVNVVKMWYHIQVGCASIVCFPLR